MAVSKTAVVIDDDPGVCALVSRTVRSEGFAVKAFGSAEAADPVVRAELPSILVVDKDLPGCSGVEWLRSLQADLHDLTPPAALISGDLENTPLADVELFDAVLAKPFRIDRLRRTIRELERLARQRRQRSEQRLVAADRDPKLRTGSS